MPRQRGPQWRVEVVHTGTPAEAAAAAQAVRVLLARWFAEKEAGLRDDRGAGGGAGG